MVFAEYTPYGDESRSSKSYCHSNRRRAWDDPHLSGVYTDPHKTERPSPAFDNLLITRDLTKRSARFYTEENLGRRVYAEPDIHCYALAPFAETPLLNSASFNILVLEGVKEMVLFN